MKTTKNITQGENIMKRTFRLTRLIAITGMACLATTMSAQAVVTIETVTIGNPGNGPDTNTSGNVIAAPEGAGAVGYVYEMGKYEVTQGQYTEFLNAVGATDTFGLYHPGMFDDPALSEEDGGDGKTTGMISQSGVSGSFTYSADPSAVNRAVNFTGWGDAARFANWMHNGQPSGLQDNSTTEDGSYFINGMNLNSELYAVTRKTGATWVIPTEDEWYKAAYHKNDGVTDNYWDMPMQNDLDPGANPGDDPVYAGGADITEATNPGNNHNHWTDGNDPIDGVWRITNVGQFNQSVSAYGTFDQAGNVFEWNETQESPDSDDGLISARGVRGQGFGSGAGHNSSARRTFTTQFFAKTDRSDFGFRMARVPEPSSLALLLATAGVLGCLTWRMQK